MASTVTTARSAKRGLLLRDSATFLALCGVTVALFLLTLLLFRSFENRREDLGRRWAERGRLALGNNHPDQAVAALRTALSYNDALPEQLLLAQALAKAGHIEEADNYFLTLRESRPGDGFINLQLARLARKQGDAPQAIDFYRASIFGDWPGDGAQRRREVRFELSGYLAQRGENSDARDELLIAAGNTPETAGVDDLFGDRLEALGDAADALQFYEKSLAVLPHGRATRGKAGQLAYHLGKYAAADKLLTEALADHAGGKLDAADETRWSTLAADARRIPQLSLSRELPASERAEHILLAATIVQARLDACAGTPAATPAATPTVASPIPPPASTPAPPALVVLRSRWSAAADQLKKRTLERDAALEDSVTQLIDDTETQTVAPCGHPVGDDALLLLLASPPHAQP